MDSTRSKRCSTSCHSQPQKYSTDQATSVQLLEGIDARLRRNQSLALDRKSVKGVDSGELSQATFRQRRSSFVGRDAELASLRAFLDDPSSFRWWQVSGEGGQGKSRLALHLIDQLAGEWDAGFLGDRGLEELIEGRVAFEAPTLCVIDYAAAPQKAARVVKAIKSCTDAPNRAQRVPGAPVRLLREMRGYDLWDLSPGTQTTHNDGSANNVTAGSLNWLDLAPPTTTPARAGWATCSAARKQARCASARSKNTPCCRSRDPTATT